VWGATWSPDGLSIAYASDVDGDYEIYVMDEAGQNPTQLTSDSASDTAPYWAP